MAYDNPEQQQAWDQASNQINAWKDQNRAGQNINWEAAQNAWNQSGGDLNSVYNQSQNWLSGGQQAQSQAAPAPSYNAKSAYEGFRNDWLGQGFGSQTNADNLAKTAAKYGYTVRNGDKVYDQAGNFIGDMIGDVGQGGANTLQFLRGAAGHATTNALYGGKSTPKGGAPKGGVSPPGPGNLPPGGAGGGGTGGGGTQSGAWGELYNELMARSRQGLNIDPNDPVIKAQTDAFRSEGNAARNNFLADQAEAAGPYGNQRSEERRSAEQLGKSVGGLQAQLMGRELDARRTEIQNALSQRESMLTDEQRRALQLQLAKMDDATRRLGLSQQNSQFGRDLEYRYKALDQNDAQFRDQLGFNYGDRSNYWDAINRGLL